MKTIQIPANAVRANVEIEPLLGSWMTDDDYDIVISGESARVLKPDGSPLLIYVKDSVPRSLCELAFETFKLIDFGAGMSNRGLAAGRLEEGDERVEGAPETVAIRPGEVRYSKIKQDGTVSNTTRAALAESAIVGYFDRYPRIPYCRQTAFTAARPAEWERTLPFIRHVSGVFREYAPEQYAAQEEFVRVCHPDFIIPETIFSTLTVNRDWRTALHRDRGDFESGLGVMSVLHAGQYEGGLLVFPRYRVAVDMRTGGVCCADVHSAHGNTEIKGVPGRYLRLSVVFYVRTGIVECGSAEFELERAKRVGDNLNTRQATTQPRIF